MAVEECARRPDVSLHLSVPFGKMAYMSSLRTYRVPSAPTASEDSTESSVSKLHLSLPLQLLEFVGATPVWLTLPWNMDHVPPIGCAAAHISTHASPANCTTLR